MLKDKERLVKRTQLKRSVYRILGTSEEDGAANSNGASESSSSKEEERGGQADTHLQEYDPEIFDDDDFYHQVSTILFYYLPFEFDNFAFSLSIAAASRVDRAEDELHGGV